MAVNGGPNFCRDGNGITALSREEMCSFISMFQVKASIWLYFYLPINISLGYISHTLPNHVLFSKKITLIFGSCNTTGKNCIAVRIVSLKFYPSICSWMRTENLIHQTITACGSSDISTLQSQDGHISQRNSPHCLLPPLSPAMLILQFDFSPKWKPCLSDASHFPKLPACQELLLTFQFCLILFASFDGIIGEIYISIKKANSTCLRDHRGNVNFLFSITILFQRG